MKSFRRIPTLSKEQRHQLEQDVEKTHKKLRLAIEKELPWRAPRYENTWRDVTLEVTVPYTTTYQDGSRHSFERKYEVNSYSHDGTLHVAVYRVLEDDSKHQVDESGVFGIRRAQSQMDHLYFVRDFNPERIRNVAVRTTKRYKAEAKRLRDAWRRDLRGQPLGF